MADFKMNVLYVPKIEDFLSVGLLHDRNTINIITWQYNRNR